MSTSSPSPPRVVIQPRDRSIFASLYTHRYLTARHIQQLHFTGNATRTLYARLRQLWQAGYLERTYTVREDWSSGRHAPPRQLLYALARKGAQVLAATSESDLTDIPHTPTQNAHGFATLQHHLVVTDCLTALEAALTDDEPDTSPTLAKVTREHVLREMLGAYAVHTEVPRPWLIPDSAFSLMYPDLQAPVTFYIEVVRSLPARGRTAFFEKLTGYTNALKAGTLTRAWEHTQVAAVLVLAPSPEKAERLRSQAERLPAHQDRFWFASYLTENERGQTTTALSPGSILTPLWRDGTGEKRTLIHP